MNIKNIVAIGVSTGGPTALSEVLKAIPNDINAPILVVQHMPEGFTSMFANRLDAECRLRVKEAENEDILANGIAYIARGDKHMEVVSRGDDLVLLVRDGEKVSGHRPSVDKLFASLTRLSKELYMVIVLMTGMGSDGAKELLNLKENGAYTIIQDENSCVVYGMPHVAKNLGAANVELSLDKIADEIIRKLEV